MVRQSIEFLHAGTRSADHHGFTEAAISSSVVRPLVIFLVIKLMETF
jgi:hypothetical protein